MVQSSHPRPGIPMWGRFAFALAVGALLLVGLVLFVDHNNGNGEASQNSRAIVRANREAEVVIGQDQAPHIIRLATTRGLPAAMQSSVRRAISQLISTGVIGGPLQHVSCRRSGGSPEQPAFSCTAIAGSVSYPFLGAIDLRRRTLALCKRDLPPVPSQNIPVRPVCTA